jgi:flagellar hook-associated protein 1 FlgK
MAGLWNILNTGRSSLAVQQLGVNTSSHNIANVNTAGFSKQRAILENRDPFQMRNGYLGMGVDLLTIDRLSGNYIHRQMVQSKSDLGYQDRSFKLLKEVEAVYTDDQDTDIQDAMTDFFDSFRQLASRPDDMSLRQDVRTKGEVISERFHKIDYELTRIQREIKPELDGRVKQINLLTKEISKLNAEIAAMEHNGHQANDLRDRQELKIRELSNYIQIDTFLDNRGFINVAIDSGEPLVSGKESYDLVVTPPATQDGYDYGIAVDRKGMYVNITNDLRGGELAALIHVRDTVIEGYKDRLDSLAYGFSTEVNRIHNNATNPDGSYTIMSDPANPGNMTAGGNFFDTLLAGQPIDASTITLSADIMASLKNIAVAQTPDGLSAYGDNRNAILMADIVKNQFMDDETYNTANPNLTFLQFYQNSVTNVGHDVQSTQMKLDYRIIEDDQLNSFREQTVGVNMDEELIELNQYQKAYEAASKIITTANTMLETILQLKQ